MSFKVSIENGRPKILLDDYVPETDIIDLLSFDENQIEDLLRDHAAIQARWEQLAINAKNELERFEDQFVKKWWAHCKSFARLALTHAFAAKNITMDAVKDTAILIYSRDTTTIVREKYAEWAFQAALKEKSVFLNGEDKDSFVQTMFKYLETDPQWFYEDLVHSVKDLEKAYQTLQNIAKRLEARSFHMKDLNELVKAKYGNVGPISYGQENRIRELEQVIAQGKLTK